MTSVDRIHFADAPSGSAKTVRWKLGRIGRTACLLGLLWAPNVVDAESTTARVAVVSFEPVKFDLAGNSRTLENWFRRAAEGRAQIAVAPEGILDGYVVNEIIAGDVSARRMNDVAVTIDSPTIRQFRKLARELNLCLVFGFAERLKGDVFNTAVFIDDQGRICGKYHKMQFHEGYDESWWFNRLGRQSRAFDTPFGRCGVLICNDRWNPLLAKIPALDGAQFLVIPAFGSTSKQQDDAVLARGTETGLPIVEANVGVSLVVSDNQVAAVSRQREGITFAEIEIPSARPIQGSERDRVEAEFLEWRESEMRVRLAQRMRDVGPRGLAHDQDVAQLNTSQLAVTVGNNKSTDLNEGHHRAGYNGLFSLRSTQDKKNAFVPAYAGLNLEHYFDGKRQDEREIFFEPRFEEMTLQRIDANTVELHQPPTSTFQVESWTRFQVREPYYVDMSFRCTPHRSDYAGDFLGVFWASYINAPLDKSIYFLDGESTLEKPMWRQLCTQLHNRDSTIRHAKDDVQLRFEHRNALFANESPLRFAVPFFYGRIRDMVMIYVFRPGSSLRFTHSPSGGGATLRGDDTNPAWDFQLIVPQPRAGRSYQLDGRLIYKRWKHRDDVIAEVKRYLQEH